MRKNYKLILGLFSAITFSFSGIAQQTSTNTYLNDLLSSPDGGYQVGADTENSKLPLATPKPGQLAAPGTIILSEDFGGGTLPTGWKTRVFSGPGGWAWSNGSSSGQYSAGIGRILSTTGANGTMLLDADNLNPGASTGFREVDAYIEIPVPNLSATNSVILQFEHYWRPFSDAELLIEVSPNGTTWDTIDVRHGVASNSTSTTAFGLARDAAYTEKINLTSMIAGATSAKIRFHWTGSSHYFWQVDDIKLIEGETNDIQMDDLAFRPFGDSLRSHYATFYTRIPSIQARAYPITVSAKYINGGASVQTGAGFNAVANGPNGYSQTISAGRSVLPTKGTDSASTASTFTFTSGPGLYNLNLIAKSDSVLKNTDDDTVGTVINVTDSTYARDNDDIANAAAYSFNAAGSVYEYDAAVVYEIKTLDTVSSISWLNLAANTRRPNKPGKVSCHIYRFGAYTANGITGIEATPIFSSPEVNISAYANRPDEWISMPISRVGGGLDTIGAGNYFVVWHVDQIFNADTIFFPVQSEPGTLFQYLLRTNSGGTLGNWSLTTRKLMIRLNTTPNVCPTLTGAMVSGKATTACGNTDGEVTVATDPTSGSGPYTYSWDINGTITSGKTVTNLGSGSYQVTITDANGCSVVSSAGVTDFGAPTVTQDVANSVTTTTCFGNKQGKIAITVVKGANPNPTYSYKWVETSAPTTTISTAATLLNVEAGTYRVEVNDGSNPPCIQSVNVTIAGPSSGITAIIPAADVEHNLCKGDVKGKAEVLLSGGTGNLTIAWNDGNTNPKRSNLATGSYAFTVTDGSGCTFTGSHQVTEPSNAFKIAPVKYDADITSTSSGIEETTSGTVELSVKGLDGTTNVVASVEWRNPKGVKVTSFTGAGKTLKVGPAEDLDRNGGGEYIAIATSGNDCKSAQIIFNVFGYEGIFPYSVKEFGVNSSLTIFPNPSNGMVNVKLDNSTSGDYTISVKNVVGQVIHTETVTSNGNLNKVLDLESANAGVYFINISNGTSDVSKKIIIE